MIIINKWFIPLISKEIVRNCTYVLDYLVLLLIRELLFFFFEGIREQIIVVLIM